MTVRAFGIPLEPSHGCWVGTIELSDWRAIIAPSRPATLTAAIWMAAEGDVDRPSPEQLAALAFLLENQASQFRTTIDHLRRYYNRLRPTHHAFLAGLPASLGLDADARMPAGPSESEFCGLLDLETAFIQTEARDGAAYISFAMHASWDEHGVAIVTHRDRVVDIGYASDFMSWHGPERDPEQLPRVPRSRKKASA